MPNVISPFRIAVSQDAIDAPASGWALGMDADYLSFLLDQWLNHFDWRSVEAHLNGFPQFIAEVGAAPVHFVHLTGSGPSRTPIILTHGWPSTFAELLRLGQALANPHNVEAEGFDVIIPSLPGYAFSPAPKALGANVFTIANQWAELMTMLGYKRFFAHGGDIGAGVTTALALLHGERLHGTMRKGGTRTFRPRNPMSSDPP
jgi:Epoxide hydrolase N terminus